MKLLKIFFIFSVVCLGSLIKTANADTVMFQCKQANGHINFTDTPCGKKQKYISKSTLKPIDNMHTVATKYTPDEPIQRYNYVPRNNPFRTIEREKREQQEREWNNLGPIGVTPLNSPSTYGYTRFAQH